MNEEQQKRRGGWFWWLVLPPVFYVLSIGPVGKAYFELETRGYDMEWSEAPFAFVYMPVFWAYRHSEFIAQVFDWYLFDLWRVGWVPIASLTSVRFALGRFNCQE